MFAAAFATDRHQEDVRRRRRRRCRRRRRRLPFTAIVGRRECPSRRVFLSLRLHCVHLNHQWWETGCMQQKSSWKSESGRWVHLSVFTRSEFLITACAPFFPPCLFLFSNFGFIYQFLDRPVQSLYSFTVAFQLLMVI